MQIDLKLAGYRCFSPNKPASISLRDGFTALIGLNNTGKSAFLRAIYELRFIFRGLATHDNQFRNAVLGTGGYTPPPQISDYQDLFWHFSDEDALLEISLPEFKNVPNTFWRATIRLCRGGQALYSLILHDFSGDPISSPKEIKPPIFAADEEVKPRGSLIRIDGVHGDLTHLLKAFEMLSRCFYCPSTRHATPFSPPDSTRRFLYDIEVGAPFIESWQRHQQYAGKASTEIIDKIVTDIQRLFRYDRLQIQATMGGPQDLLIVANGKSLRLSDLGSGFAQFVILLGNIAFQGPTWILVDEPELNLHPALQLEFLQALAARASEGVVFATHSLGLARQVAAEQTYTFSQVSGETSVNHINSTNNLNEIIGEMSFGRIDFSARKVLLVEGHTDVLTFEALLSMVNKEHEFAILSLGGSVDGKRREELQHISALKLQISAVIDSEKASFSAAIEPARKGFQMVCQNLAITCHILERRAIENYFTLRAIKVALGSKHLFRELQPYESLIAVPHHWKKRDNWKIARATHWNEIEQTDLGHWLTELRKK